MLFETKGAKGSPAVLFFHAMGVTGASSERVAECLQDKYFCIMPTSTVYCEGQKYISKADEIRQVEEFLAKECVAKLALVVASSIGADLAMAFLSQTKIPVECFWNLAVSRTTLSTAKVSKKLIRMQIFPSLKITITCSIKSAIPKDLRKCWIVSCRKTSCRNCRL